MKLSRPLFELADVIANHRHELENMHKLSARQKRVFTNLSQCRTDALGYHKDKCNYPGCGHIHISYNSCRDRHCPKCNGSKREKWVSKRVQDLLPVKYYHVVFTVTDMLNPLFLKHRKLLFNLLFKCAWLTIQEFGYNPKHLGAKTGMVAILHTWGQNIAFHPHIHCIVPAGGIAKCGKWKNSKSDGKFLFPVKALSKVFRGKFTDGLIKLEQRGDISLDHMFVPGKKYLHPYYKKSWVVYAKLPLFNAMQVVNYIGRYSHRVAICNRRIKSFGNGRVVFSYFNYRTAKPGLINLSAVDFLNRFALHILPPGFMKIRHYGFLSAKNKSKAIDLISEQLVHISPVAFSNLKNSASSNDFLFTCPVCNIGKMIVFDIIPPKNRGSPANDISFNHNFYAC